MSDSADKTIDEKQLYGILRAGGLADRLAIMHATNKISGNSELLLGVVTTMDEQTKEVRVIPLGVLFRDVDAMQRIYHAEKQMICSYLDRVESDELPKGSA